MKLLAMDLSLSSPAFAVVEVMDGRVKVHHLSHLKTKTGTTQNYRLFQIYNYLKDIIMEHTDITEVAREKGFSRFANVTQILFRVVGVSDICIMKYLGIQKITEIAPTSVKKAVAGSGKASKTQVEDALRNTFGLDYEYSSDDESDAMAVAVTYILQQEAIDIKNE